MEIKTFNCLSADALKIRTTVFVNEQGFHDEFDKIDDIAMHFVMYDGNKPIATCRVFKKLEENKYILGRMAVISEYRRQNLGTNLLSFAEKYVKDIGGAELMLHSQCRASEFYKKAGYCEYGEIENEEGHPHIWMKKILK